MNEKKSLVNAANVFMVTYHNIVNFYVFTSIKFIFRCTIDNKLFMFLKQNNMQSNLGKKTTPESDRLLIPYDF